MKILQICLTTIFFFFSVTTGYADWKIKDGEELVYSATWTGVPAGEISMDTVKIPRYGDEIYEFRLKAETNSFWSMVYRVRDKIHSRINLKEGRSYYYYKDVRQGRRHLEEKTTINYDGLKIIHSKQNFSAKEKAHIKEHKMDPEKHKLILDPLSMIYALRAIDFSKLDQQSEKDKLKFIVFAGKGLYDLEFEVKKEEKVNLKAFEERDVWLLEPSAAYKGGIVDAGRLQIWLDKKTGIPLKLMFHIPVGWATLELRECNNSEIKKQVRKSFRRRR
jgi:hypothetical protein